MALQQTPNVTSASELMYKIQALRRDLSPELVKAATFVLNNPTEISLTSIRKLAVRAGVKPNALVRLAHVAGYASFEEMREVFRNEIRRGPEALPAQATWDRHGATQETARRLYSEMAQQLTSNVQAFFQAPGQPDLPAIARDLVRANRTFVLGVGVANAAVCNFSYLAGMAIDNVHAMPSDGMLPADRLAHATDRDLLVAVTFHPYRVEVTDAVRIALDLGLPLVAVSDSLASPIMVGAKHQVVLPVGSPGHFVSTVALTAFFETLTAFVVAEAGSQASERIETFRNQREQVGVYTNEK